MDIVEYTRKPFTVNAVEVTFDNCEEVAKWCGGTVGTTTYRLMGKPTELPCVKITGMGHQKNKEFTALIGHRVVEQNGSFRVYKPMQFDSTFEKKDQLTPIEKAFRDGAVGLGVCEADYTVILDEAEGMDLSKVPNVEPTVVVEIPQFEKDDYVQVISDVSEHFGLFGTVVEDPENDLNLVPVSLADLSGTFLFSRAALKKVNVL